MKPQNIQPLLLVTSCVVIEDDDVVLRDPKGRIMHTLEPLEHGLTNDPRLPMIIYDGSNFDFISILKKKIRIKY
jgi:hypothetical protein